MSEAANDQVIVVLFFAFAERLSLGFCIHSKTRQAKFIVLHQRLLPLRPAASTVIIALQAVTYVLLMVVAL